MTGQTPTTRHTSALLLTGLTVACAVVPAAAAEAFSSPLTIPAPLHAGPQALAIDRAGTAIVVWGSAESDGAPGRVAIDVVRAGGAPRTRWERGEAVVLDSARSAGGDLDVLVQEGTRSPHRLVLYEARRDGSVRRAWSTKVQVAARGGRLHGKVARRGTRVAVSWLTSPSTRRRTAPRLWLATGEIGKRLQTHRVVGVLPASIDNHLGFMHDSDLAIGASGEPVIALTATRRFVRRLVVASLTARGRVRTRQLSRGVEGLVTIRAAPNGRLGVLVEDTGITDDVGECIADLTARRLSASVREPGSPRFGTLQLVATPAESCHFAPGRLLAAPGNGLAVVWGTVPESPQPPPTVQIALADAGRRFTPPVTIATGQLLRSAVFDASALNVAMTTVGSEPPYYNPTAGSLASQRFASGAPAAPVLLDAGPVWKVLSDSDPSGLVATAWQHKPGDDLRLSVQPGGA